MEPTGRSTFNLNEDPSSSYAKDSQAKEGVVLSAKYIPSDKKFTVASFDGGGTRGIVSMTFMNEIIKRVGLEASEFLNLVAGTSTGGLLAAAYVAHKNDKPLFKATQLPSFWKEKIGEVFHQNHCWIEPWFDGILWPKYSAVGIEKVLNELTDDSMDISSNLSASSIFTCFDATANDALYFKSREAEKSLDKTMYKITKVLRATTAAPCYLPAAKLNINGETHVGLDGGLVENNPAIAAYLEAQMLTPHSRNIQVLSFGTGEVDYSVSYKRLANAGLISDAPVVINAIFSGMESRPGKFLKPLLEDNYMRFQMHGIDSKYSGLDDISSIPYLEEKTIEWIKDNNDVFERVTARIKPKFDPQDPYAKPVEFY